MARIGLIESFLISCSNFLLPFVSEYTKKHWSTIAIHYARFFSMHCVYIVGYCECHEFRARCIGSGQETQPKERESIGKIRWSVLSTNTYVNSSTKLCQTPGWNELKVQQQREKLHFSFEKQRMLGSASFMTRTMQEITLSILPNIYSAFLVDSNDKYFVRFVKRQFVHLCWKTPTFSDISI